VRAACLEMIHELARRDPRVVFVGSDLGPGVLPGMRDEFPDRFFMEGVSEAGVIGMAAGLAMDGYIPFVNTIATFIVRRAFEQVALDACLHELPIRFVANGGGLVYAPLGPTHLAIEDIALLRALPGMTIVAPADADEMRRFMPHTLTWPAPIYVRLGKGGDPVVSADERGFQIGKAILVRDAPPSPRTVLMVSTGVMTHRCLTAAQSLALRGIACRLLHVHTLKPFDGEGLDRAAEGAAAILTVEEHVRAGGLGSAVLEHRADVGAREVPIRRLGIPDAFAPHYGSQDDLLDTYGLQPEPIAEAAAHLLTGTRHG
jgi:transketolase